MTINKTRNGFTETVLIAKILITQRTLYKFKLLENKQNFLLENIFTRRP